MNYFIFGMCLTLGFNSCLAYMADSFIAALAAIVGGVASAIAVAYLKRKWEKRE